MHDTTPALSADARSALRSAIVTHTDWCTYRRANGLSLASMTRAEYIATARALNIDVDGIAAAHGTGRQPQQRAGHTLADQARVMGGADHTPIDSPVVHTARANANFPTSELTLGTHKVAAAVALLRRLGYDWCNQADAWTKIDW